MVASRKPGPTEIRRVSLKSEEFGVCQPRFLRQSEPVPTKPSRETSSHPFSGGRHCEPQRFSDAAWVAQRGSGKAEGLTFQVRLLFALCGCATLLSKPVTSSHPPLSPSLGGSATVQPWCPLLCRGGTHSSFAAAPRGVARIKIRARSRARAGQRCTELALYLLRGPPSVRWTELC